MYDYLKKCDYFLQLRLLLKICGDYFLRLRLLLKICDDYDYSNR